MKISSAIVALVATLPSSSLAADECVLGSFAFEFDGACTPDAVVSAYEDQVFDATGSTTATCAESASGDLTSKLAAAGLTLDDLCDQVYSTQEQVPFTEAARRGDDLHFESMFYNGRTDWQEEVQTIYETEERTATSVLKQDAEAVRTFFDGVAQGRRVEWPGSLPNFQSAVTDDDGLATCTTNAAMCCWPKDRQANDNNGNCATPYDENCVDKDPADNTNLCFVDPERGNQSTGYSSDTGFFGFPEDNNDGEGAIHCHGLAWSNDVNHHTARYKSNNMFFVSMYDHMYQRGYVKNIPGAPMCGCVEQMPTVSRSDCTQVDLTETVRITFRADTGEFTAVMTDVHVDFNACQGINNRNNDLWAYMGRLYYEGQVTPAQFGELGRIITNTGCKEATRYHLNNIDLTRGYDHDVATYTKVAGRDDMYDGHPYGMDAFKEAFWEGSLTKPTDYGVAEFPVGETPIIMRICPGCAGTHRKIWYRRKTPITNEGLDLLKDLLYRRDENARPENVWGVDFSLHSSYEDAVSGENPWQCPNGNFNYYAPFTGECSPTGQRVRNQYSIFSWYPGPQPDVAYYVNKPEADGIQELDLSSSLRFSNLYTDVDIGSPGIPGRVFEREDGALLISGGGHDIWGYSDMGHFFSEPASGDVDVKVHISAFTGIVNEYAKAGLMLRSNNDADATHVYGMLSGSRGLTLTSRRTKGMYSYRSTGWYNTPPPLASAWIRLVKKMDVVEMYRSTDGENWIFYHSVEVRFREDTFRVGLAVTSHHNSYVSEATFEDYTIDSYDFPTSAPSVSSAPSAWDPVANIDGAHAGTYTYYPDTGISNYKGYGTGIWGTSDSFYFHNHQKYADAAFDVSAYTHRFHTGHMHAKGGIMIRDSDAPDAANVFLGVSGYYIGVTFTSRASVGAVTVHHQTNWVPNHNAYIKLSKAANGGIITAYYKTGADDEWMEIGSTEVAFTGSMVLVGTAVTSGDPNGSGYVDLQTKEFEIVDGTTRMLRA